jgi:predicted outer membrane protein
MNLRKVIAVPVCGAALISVALVAAQERQAQPARQPGQAQPAQTQPGQAQQAGRPTAVDQRAQWQNADQTLATCVAIDNQEEVALAKFAQDKVRHEDVKKFTKMMVEDHQAFLQKLQKFSPEAMRDEFLNEQSASKRTESARSPSKSGVDQANATNAERPVIQQTNATQPTASRSGQALDFLQIHREIAQECLASSKEELGKKKDAELDQCFIGFQIAKHAAMKTKLTVLQRHASPELAQVFAQGAETSEKHLKEAVEIMKKLDNSDSKSRREERREERREDKKETDKN